MRNRAVSASVFSSSSLSSLAGLSCLAAVAACAAGDSSGWQDQVTPPAGESAKPPSSTSTGPSPTEVQASGAPTVSKEKPPPPWTGSAPKGSVPVTGGTLLVTSDGQTVVAADPDRDVVSIVDLGSQSLLAQLELPSGAEPGRIVEDGSGQVHVVLRRGGGIADIDLFGHTLLNVRQVCALPRGIAYRPTDGVLLVTCMTGSIVTMATDATKTKPIATMTVHTTTGPVTDLRDILVTGDSAYVTTFRSAEVLKVGANGLVVGDAVVLNTRVDPSANELAENGLPGGTPQNYVPEVAWRAVLGPAGDIVIVHEGGTDRVINIAEDDNGGTQVPVSTACSSSEYGGTVCTTESGQPICSPPILIGAVSSVSTSGIVSDGPALPNGALPVDIVPSADGRTYTIALAGNPGGTLAADGSALLNVLTVPAVNPLVGPSGNAGSFDGDLCGLAFAQSGVTVPGEVTAVALDASGQVLAQTREPATIQYLTASGIVAIPLSATSVADAGFDLFHTNTGRGMTCAGCHAEGQDDGRTWSFTNGFNADGSPVAVEPRRTQTFRAGFLDTAPFHWNAEFPGMTPLVQDVFMHRMGASFEPTQAEESALAQWMDGIPPKMHDAPSAALAQSIAAGKALFMDPSVGCATCHSGASFTNNQNADIGFGVALQVPTLIDVGFRAPYLHDGSAATLEGRFTDATAKSGKHGITANLPASQIDHMIAYLESL